MSKIRRVLEAADLGDHRTASKVVLFTQRDKAFLRILSRPRRMSKIRKVLEAADLGDHRTASKVVPFTQRDKLFFEEIQPASKNERIQEEPQGC